jgi:hypothetical protein
MVDMLVNRRAKMWKEMTGKDVKRVWVQSLSVGKAAGKLSE